MPHRARQMTQKDYEYYDYLIGMDSANIRNMKRIAGNAVNGEKIYKMLSFADYKNNQCLKEANDVADPWYTGDFEATYRDICLLYTSSTGVATKELNRNFIGCEIDPVFFEAARKRIEAVSYTHLFC